MKLPNLIKRSIPATYVIIVSFIVLFLCWVVYFVIHVTHIFFFNLSFFVQLDKKRVIPYFVFGKFPPSDLEFRFQIRFYSSGVISPVRRQKLRYLQVTEQYACYGTVQHLYSSFPGSTMVKMDWRRGIHRPLCAALVVVVVFQWFSFSLLHRRRIIRHL